MPDKPPKHVVDYFRRGQLLFLVDGEWQITLAEPLIQWATPVAEAMGVSITNVRPVAIFRSVEELIQGNQEGSEGGPQEPPPPDIVGPIISLEKSEGKKPYSSPSVEEQGSFVLVAADVPELAVIPEPDPDDPDKLPAELSRNASRLLALIRALDRIRGNVFEGRLQVVSPNWLASSGKDSQPGTTGGPGAKPKPVDGSEANRKIEEYGFKLDDLPTDLRDKVENGNMGAGVVVAILDTAPKKNLDEIYKEWVTDRPDDPHPLIGSLLDPANRRLTVHPNPNIDSAVPTIEPAQYIQADGHDYEMTDHGLFVAGIIHSLAPKAELHLYQVLNRYGVGDLVSIADALQHVYDNFAPDPLVVSLSLTFGPPIVKEHSKDDDGDDMGRSLLSSKEDESDNPWFARRDLVARRISELAYAIGSRVIAAAGNNRKKNKPSPRPQACYPAALESVLGVGALPKSKKPQNSNEKLKTASYSNLSDRPDGTGITTLGGEEGEGKAVLGIYIEGFPRNEDPPNANPDTDPSLNGWGWWAGTSFATPIISGITAAVLSGLPDGSTTEDAIRELFEAQEYETEQFEDVLFVTQGSVPP